MTRWHLLRRHLPRRRSARVRLSKAVPSRADRRELRRKFRAMIRASRVERRRRVTAGLSTLANRRVRISAVCPGVVGDELIEFVDGSRVWLDVRDGSAELRRLAALAACKDLYLRGIEPCFGCCWYQLAFASVEQPGPTIFARVTRYESKTVFVSWDPGFRWQLRRRERHYG